MRRGFLFFSILAGMIWAVPARSASTEAAAFSGPDYVHAAFDAGGAAIWIQAAALFPLGVLDSYGDESDGHFARSVAFLAYQPIRFGTESILELAAWRHYQGRRSVRAVVAFYPQLTGFAGDAFSGPTASRARGWVAGTAGPLYGFETEAPLGPRLISQSRFLFASRSGGFRDDVVFSMGQGLGYRITLPFPVPGGLRLDPGLSLGAVYSDAWSGDGEEDYENYNSVAFLAGPELGIGLPCFGMGMAGIRLAMDCGPVLHHRKFNHTGAGGFGNEFQRAFAARIRMQASAGLVF